MKEWLKSLIAPVIFIAVIAVALYILIQNIQPVPDEKIIDIKAFASEETEFVLENDYLKLTMDAATTQFTVTVKETGEVWRSNPENAEVDPIALTSEKGKNQSTMVLSYSNKQGIDVALNNYDYSISRGIYEVTADDNSIRIDYSIGDIQKEFMIPPVIRKADMEEITGRMEQNDKLLVLDYYKKYDIKKLGKKDNKEELLERYPELENGVLYILRDTTTDPLKAKFQGFFEAAGYTTEEYERDKALDTGIVVSDKPVFNASLIYTLEGRDLKVELPMNSLDGKEDYPIYEISILPMFGAGNNTSDGYMFVPEGGGAIINMNNGKTSQMAYYANVYGWDRCIDRDYVVSETRINNPVFGATDGESSFLCFLEEGASYASIYSDIAGKKNSFNTVNASFRIKKRDEYNVADRIGGKMYVYTESIPDESLVQRYRFYNTNDYNKLALNYREYLFEKYPNLFEKKTDTSTPVCVEVLGAVDKVKQVMGIPVSKPLELTTYEEAENLLGELKSSGMNNMYVKLTGWANDGVRQTMLSDVDLVSELGSKKSFDSLLKFASDNDIKLCLNGITNVAIDSNLFDGFWSFSDAARFITKERAEVIDYRIVTYIKDKDSEPNYLLSPENIYDCVDTLTEFCAENGAGVSFEDFGYDLPSDFRRSDPVSRQTVKNAQEEKLAKLAAEGTPIIVNGGSDYVLPYASMVVNVNLSGHEYTIIDKKIPFFQIALHGYVNYTGEALNLTQNKEDELLKSVEYGAGLMFHVMDESAFALQKTTYTEYFGSEYDTAKDYIVNTYNQINRDLGHTYNQEIVSHEFVTDKLTCTTYEDGTKVYVNYDYEDATIPEGTAISARTYLVIR